MSAIDNYISELESRLAAGVCHLTAEAAEMHTRALLSFTATGKK